MMQAHNKVIFCVLLLRSWL